MTFSQPWMLLGLLGGLLPILIHLIHRFRPRQQAFPAMELLLRSVKRVERKWRLRRFVLLLLRVLLLAAFAMAAAGPLLGTPPRQAAYDPAASERVAIVIDASLSMRAQYGNRTAFSLAIDAAYSIVEQLRASDEGLIVVAGNPPQLPLAQPTGDRGRLTGVLSRLQPHWRSSSLTEAISTATEALGHSTNTPQAPNPSNFAYRVVVLSDFTNNSIEGPAHLNISGSDSIARLQLIDVLKNIDNDKRANYSIVNALSEIVPNGVPRMVALHTRIQSYGEAKSPTQPQQRALELHTRQELLHHTNVDVLPSTMTESSFRHTFASSGSQLCTLVLEPDRLLEDNRYYLRIDVRKYVRSLIVDGDPSGIEKEDEIFYLERAYRAGSPDQPSPRIISADDLSRADLNQFDVVILAGVPFLSRDDFERLSIFVNDGGGLWITTSEGLDAKGYSEGLQSLVPGSFEEPRATREHDVIHFARPQLEHPILKLFEGEPLNGLLSTKTRAYITFSPKKNAEPDIPLRFADQAPALLLYNTAPGRVAILTTSIDRDLTDLPIRPAFVPLVRQIVLWLGHALSEPNPRRLYVGDGQQVLIPPGASQVQIHGPSGKTTVFEAPELNQEYVRFADTNEPGFYTVSAKINDGLIRMPKSDFAVNINPSESDLRPIPIEDALAILQGEQSGRSQEPLPSSAPYRILGKLGQDYLARLLLLLMGLAFLLESGLTAGRIGR